MTTFFNFKIIKSLVSKKYFCHYNGKCSLFIFRHTISAEQVFGLGVVVAISLRYCNNSLPV